MPRYQITIRNTPSDGEPAVPQRSKFQRLRSAIFGFLLSSLAIGVVLSALVLGSVLVILILIVVFLAIATWFVSRWWRKGFSSNKPKN